MDYYDEFRERHPTDFIELMIVANNIPAERKKRLSAHGISYREIPEPMFAPRNETDYPTKSGLHEKANTDAQVLSSTDESGRSSERQGAWKNSGLEASEYIVAVRIALKKNGALDPNRWRVGGDDRCLTAKCIALTEPISKEGFEAQIWIDRNHRCTFEICKNDRGAIRRDAIAAVIRSHLVKLGLPAIVMESARSTVVRVPKGHSGVVENVVDFAAWLDKSVQGVETLFR
jgi:hypothetical protein